MTTIINRSYNIYNAISLPGEGECNFPDFISLFELPRILRNDSRVLACCLFHDFKFKVCLCLEILPFTAR